MALFFYNLLGTSLLWVDVRRVDILVLRERRLRGTSASVFSRHLVSYETDPGSTWRPLSVTTSLSISKCTTPTIVHFTKISETWTGTSILLFQLTLVGVLTPDSTHGFSKYTCLWVTVTPLENMSSSSRHWNSRPYHHFCSIYMSGITPDREEEGSYMSPGKHRPFPVLSSPPVSSGGRSARR